MKIKHFLAVTGGALLPLLCALAEAPQPATASVPPPELGAPPSAPHTAQLTAEDVSAFLDGMLPTAMAIGDIAGAVVVVVKDDRVLVTKGYGFADVEKRAPVSGETTLFRPGSISKLFTWTAVMQQVEEGKLELDRDINAYLDFTVNGLDGRPVTLRHLLTHTPGFEERLQDLLIDDASQMKPLDVMLKEGVPRAIFPPGAVPAYSNYGAALAGYIVQRVSGMSFDEYVEQRIFRPLGMAASTFRQPVPEGLAGRLSHSYLRASGKTVDFEYCPDAPAGSLSASGTDMAQFMLAHLNAGVLPAAGESSRILKPETLAQMHAVANRPGPTVDAMALGFYEQNRNGVRAIAHGGDLTAFHSDLLLIPHAKVGLYLSFNSVGRNNAAYPLRTALTDGFMDRYFPRADARVSGTAAPGTTKRAQAVTGSYELSRRAEKNLFSFFYMLNQTQASVTDKGYLQIAALTGLNDEPKQFEEIEPWLWREAAGETRLAVVRADNGAIERLVPDGYGPIFVFQPTPGWRDARWLQPAIIAAAVVLVATVLGWLVRAIRRRFRRTPQAAADTAGNTRLRLAARLGIACAFVFLVFLGVLVLALSGDSFWILSSSARPLLRLIQLSGFGAVLGAIAAIVAAVSSWRTPGERWWRSLGKTTLAAACAVCAYVAIAFHFLSPRLLF